jgi:formate dehydrogenase major subunit
MKARERGATLIHVDPRFSRTSAMADMHVPIRAGSDIAFLGGLIRHVLHTESYFKEYVLAYTNASTLVNDEFKGPEDLAGFFSGWDPESATYNPETWGYKGGQLAAPAGRRSASTRAPGCTRARSSATSRSRTRAPCSAS